MTQIAPNPAYDLIADQIDAVGQKYRVQRIIRGAMLWLGTAVIATLAAAFLAHFAGQSILTRIVLVAWVGWLLFGTWRWIARPLFIRPDPVEVARLIESRVDGLHNGLTNSLLLARRDDLSQSPWLGQIFDEILITTSDKPLGSAIKMSDLRPDGIRLAVVAVPLLLLALVMPKAFAHGWQQMFNPSAFVPKIGGAEILDLQPKDVTLVAGQPLEFTMSARAPGTPVAKLIFEKLAGDAGQVFSAPPNAELTPATLADNGASTDQRSDLQYNFRVDHVDGPIRYRAEVAGTQSPWYTVMVVRQVKLTELRLRITPPAYVGQEPREITMKPGEIARTAIAVPEGSRVMLSATVDVPVGGGMLQAGDAAPLPMEKSREGLRFEGTVTLLDDTALAVLLTEGSKQIIARVPEETFVVHVLKDALPKVEMKWPAQDLTLAPEAELKVTALLSDDYGIASARVLMGSDAPAPKPSGSQDAPAPDAPSLAAVHSETFDAGIGVKQPREFSFVLQLTPEQRKHGKSIQVQVETTDDRDVPAVAASATASPSGSASARTGGPQTTASPVFKITFADPKKIAEEKKDNEDLLREKLKEMLKRQQALHEQAVAAGQKDRDAMTAINAGQTELRTFMQTTAETFNFEPDDRVVQKTLLMLAFNPGKEAIDFSASLRTEPVDKERRHLATELQARQRRIIETLQSLLAMLHAPQEPTTQPTKEGDQLLTKADQFKKLDEQLKEWMKEQRKLLDQTAGLAKKPVDNFDDQDKKKMEELKQTADKIDAFMQEKVADFSKNSEQDMANSSLLKELLEVYSETTMVKDALKAKNVEMAIAAEEMGLGLEKAKELESNLEKWLSNTPDRQKWNQEDPLSKADLPMPELPKELEDMVGELMEQQEDMAEEAEDTNANYADSMDKGVGWDAADGPIADMSAKGITGNQLPNNNEMNGRSGEGRSGKSQGEFVDETAKGKGGRMTPTRLDPTPFQKGQVKDESKDPVGGATGGGKMSGEGGQGLQGPVPPKMKMEMERLKTKQAELRNKAERLNLQYKLTRYDNYKLLQAVALMRQTESDLDANRYQNMMRRNEVILDALDTSRMLLGGQVHAQRDSTPSMNQKLKEQINDAMKGELPPAWSDALKEYYKKLGQE